MKSNPVLRTITLPWTRTIAGRMILFFCALSMGVLLLVQTVELYGLPFGIMKGDIRSITERELMTLSTLADTRKQLIESWIWERRGDAMTITKSPAIQDLAAGRMNVATKRSLISWLNSYGYAYQYETIRIVDTRTNSTIFSSADSAATKGPLASYLIDAASPGIDESVTYAAEPPAKKAKLHIIHQITSEDSPDEQTIALIDLALDPEIVLKPRLESGISNLLGKSGAFVLADSQGNILLKPQHGPVSTEQDTPLQLAMSGGDGMISTKDARGEKVLAVYRHIRITPDISWALVIQKDQKEVLAEAERRRQLFLVFSLVGIAATVFLSLLVARMLTRPLSLMAATAVRIEAGDLTARVPISGADEITALAETFNKMADKVQRWHEDFDAKVLSQTELIRKLNAELEQRVVERTIQLETSNQELESFCYSVSHDLRAPLRNINMYSGILKEDYRASLNEKGWEYLEKLSEATLRMGKIIDDLLTLSRVSRVELSPQAVDISALFRSAADALMESSAGRTVEFSIAEKIIVQGDPTLLAMVVQNLMENAWKYTRREEQAIIVFGSKQENNELIYYLNDNGTGFDMAYAENLFKPFQRLHSPGEFEGTGIGLATVQRIIQRHGGRIWAEAIPDKGATFFFILPHKQDKL